MVVLAGDLHLSRVGVSINTNAGLTDLVAQNESEYIRIATELAQDERRLLKYNQTLRNQFLNSKVCDAASFTKNLEEAYKSMYDKWINDPEGVRDDVENLTRDHDSPEKATTPQMKAPPSRQKAAH